MPTVFGTRSGAALVTGGRPPQPGRERRNHIAVMLRRAKKKRRQTRRDRVQRRRGGRYGPGDGDEVYDRNEDGSVSESWISHGADGWGENSMAGAHLSFRPTVGFQFDRTRADADHGRDSVRN